MLIDSLFDSRCQNVVMTLRHEKYLSMSFSEILPSCDNPITFEYVRYYPDTAPVKALTADEFQRYSLPRSESAFDESTGTRSWSFEGHNGIRATVSYTWGDSGFGCSNGRTQVAFLTEEGEGIQLDSNIDSMIDACITDVQFQNLDSEPSQELFIQYGNSGSGNFHGLLIVDLQNYISKPGQPSTFTLRDYYEGVILWDDDFDDIYEVRMAPVGQQQSLYRWDSEELVSSQQFLSRQQCSM